jgi:transposase
MATIKKRTHIQPQRRPRVNAQGLPIIQPDTAAVDIGATLLCAAVPVDRDARPVRSFGTFTPDLEELSAWLRQCRIRSVALEATGVYWIPVFQILAAAGFEVCLVNPRHVKHVSGRKTDVSDCQWLQHLHAVGLLRPSFRPSDDLCALRTIHRQREHLVQQAAEQIQLMQKSLDQMNLHLHHVLSDLAGVSGLRIVDAILEGERDARVLAKLRDPRVQTDEEVIVAALTGDWRPEHVFTLQQARQTFSHYQTLLQACDAEIERWLRSHAAPPSAPNSETVPPPPPPASEARPPEQRRTKPRRNEPCLPTLDLRRELHQRFGVDLTAIPAFGISTVAALYAELGPDLQRAFPTDKQFVSWLAVCPDPRKSGGKVLNSRTRDVQHRVAHIFRQAAQSVYRSDNHIGRFYRRIRAKLGGPQAVTATAHKLARIFYHMVTTREEYDETHFQRCDEQQRQRHLASVQRQAKHLGFTLEPIQVT